MTVTEPTAQADEATETPEAEVVDDTASLVADELLVEEISIDGMCGVY